ncbi:MAG: methyltransferase, partial [Prevotella sp.]|nr:methyltransferase [Prevotella sp.]
MSTFRFKQFAISQDRCAMKVGTDGVLLGAWAAGGTRILDVGTGTGLVALMMAQRFPEARVTAIDVDEGAVEQARENVAASPFSDRVEVVWSDVQSFVGQTFDAIVCNPPYFANSLKCPDSRRTLARHSDSLSAADLAAAADRLLCSDGVLSVVLPTDVMAAFEAAVADKGFAVVRQCLVKTSNRRPAKRCLLTFCR